MPSPPWQLDVSFNKIGSVGAEAIAPALVTSASLTSLDVRHNDIEGDGASQLSTVVLSNLKLETFNEIPIKEMRADSLTELNLEGKYIGVVGSMVLAGLLPVMGSITSVR